MRGQILHLPHFGDGLEVRFSFCEEVAQANGVEGLVEMEDGDIGFLGGEEGAFEGWWDFGRN